MYRLSHNWWVLTRCFGSLLVKSPAPSSLKSEVKLSGHPLNQGSLVFFVGVSGRSTVQLYCDNIGVQCSIILVAQSYASHLGGTANSSEYSQWLAGKSCTLPHGICHGSFFTVMDWNCVTCSCPYMENCRANLSFVKPTYAWLCTCRFYNEWFSHNAQNEQRSN